MKIVILLFTAIISGCSITTAVPVKYSDSKTEGFRIYDPKPLLVITDKQASIVFVPDYTRGYAVKFKAYLAKNKSKMVASNGAMTEINADIDSTGVLDLLSSLGQEALKQAKTLSALGADVTGTISNKQGIYEFNFDVQGNFTGLTKLPM